MATFPHHLYPESGLKLTALVPNSCQLDKHLQAGRAQTWSQASASILLSAPRPQLPLVYKRA